MPAPPRSHQLAVDLTPPPAGDEAAIVDRARSDPDAFALLYDRYVDPIYRFCYRRLESREAAEDATSLVFAKALAALPRYRDRSFRSWLFAIAHNVVADTFRAAHHDGPLALVAELADAGPSPEAMAIAVEERESVRALLAQLPPDQRHLLELRLAGLTDAEIARALGRSHGSVRVAQYRAIARLRSLLGPAEEGRDG